MKVFIIGNGFDKGHKLRTSYWDFRMFLEKCYPDFLYAFELNYDIYPGFSEDEKKELLWNEFESNLANIDEDIIIENAISIDMGLESGDIGIEDNLYTYFSEEFNYIKELPYYLKLWIQSIRVRDLQPKTKIIDDKNNDMYITFNYTSVLENVYKISENRIIHIHGSLRRRDGNPVIGHGNYTRMENIKEIHRKADEIFDEKESSISRVIEDYYNSTHKNVSSYMHKLYDIKDKDIDEVIIIGHSLSGVDMPYFTMINHYVKNKAKWKVYYYDKSEKNQMYENLIECGIKEN
ncbi:bacteriophage abortive infection AbiH family protein [Clostridium sp.]|uniref:bacteriophage abortive infection AbiH family protein n=1 Tax=Clostridium sp. TaxID=1506 RepID=UPI002841EB8C|nr:bacteriophage abortive infection AbiH family protein [Clostridium sp.]MDR3598076.1 bacteriophage abortive infection AbiH family protein [Clostridium sp.]